MRLVTYDRGGARRLGAWVDRTVVDLPDAVGHPAFPPTMEALVARHAGTTLDAARAALSHSGVASEFGVAAPRLLTPIIPSSVRVVPASKNDRQAGGDAGPDTDLEVACIIGAGGANMTVREAAMAIFGYSLVTSTALGPSVLTLDEFPASDRGLVVTVDGKPFGEAEFDAAHLMAVISHTSRDEELRPGDVFLFRTFARSLVPGRRSRFRVSAAMDLEAGGSGLWRKASGLP